MMYSAFVYPHINYCSNTWSSTPETNIALLHRTMNRCCRAVLGIKDIRTSSTAMYKKLKWLPVKELFDYNVVMEMHRCLKGIAKYPIAFPPLHETVHGYPTRNNRDFDIPNVNLSLMKKAFCIRGPIVWNSLPIEIKEINSLSELKKSYKQILLQQVASN